MENPVRKFKEDEFIEQFGVYFERSGYTRMAGRIFGFLLISNPPHQSMGQIVERLHASKSSISTNARLLIQLNLVDQIPIPGERPLFYRVRPGGWTAVFLERLMAVTRARTLLADGLALLTGQPEEQRARLEEMDDMYAFCERELPEMFARWKARRNSLAPDQITDRKGNDGSQ